MVMAQLNRRAGGVVTSRSTATSILDQQHSGSADYDENDNGTLNEVDLMERSSRRGLHRQQNHRRANQHGAWATSRPTTLSRPYHRAHSSTSMSTTCGISRMNCVLVVTSLLASMGMLWSSLRSTGRWNSARRNRTTDYSYYNRPERPLLLSIDPVPASSSSSSFVDKQHNHHPNRKAVFLRDSRAKADHTMQRLQDITESSALAAAAAVVAASSSSRYYPAVHLSSELPETSLFIEYLDDLDWMDNFLSPDYGGLELESKRTLADFYRSIDAATDYKIANRYRAHVLKVAEDIHVSSEYEASWEDMEYEPGDCVTPLWSVTFRPNCNVVHEYVQLEASPAETTTQTLDTHYLAHGYYRDSFLLNNTRDRVVLKKLRYKHDSDIRMQSKMMTEANIMAALSGSPVVSNLYSYCSTTLIVESAQDFHWDLVPHHPAQDERGRISHDSLRVLEHRYSRGGPFSFNNYTVEHKLQMALEMAEGLAEMHGYVGGVIVNDDVHPEQWLFAEDGRTILNDMNNAVVLEWNFEKQEYCQYYTSYGGDYRAPEEYRDDGADVDETVDIWPMGNLIHTLFTGLWPYYDLDDEEDIQAATMRGERPYLHPEFRTRSLIERRMTEIMDQCHVLEPQDRVDIFTVVAHLRETQRLAQEEKARYIRDTTTTVSNTVKAQGSQNPPKSPAHDQKQLPGTTTTEADKKPATKTLKAAKKLKGTNNSNVIATSE